MAQQQNHQPQSGKQHHHHILPYGAAAAIFAALLFLTFLTVYMAEIDLGRLNFVVAFFIATTKATLVALFFMNLYWDQKENGGIFATAFIFLAIFIVLTSMDLFFRGNVYLKPGELEARAA